MTEPVAALQTALAAEHAAIWAYPVVGARVGAALRAQVWQADLTHRTRRDATAGLIRRYGGDPVPSGAEYSLPFPVSNRTTALRLAVHLEEGVAAAWRYVIAATEEQAVRRDALAALTDAAVQATRWRLIVTPGRPTVPFPGDTG
jgi:Domain of unknown function (DUF4439)